MQLSRLGILLPLIVVSCTAKNADYAAPKAEDAPQIISDRPQAPSAFIATVKLTAPSLIESAQKDKDGKVVIPPEAAKAIEEEQNAVISQLKEASPKIQILYRYRMILNGMAFLAPPEAINVINKMPGVKVVEPSRAIGRPMVAATSAVNKNEKGFPLTSVDFIEATKVHKELGATGQRMRIGIIDTGIDYTHKMLGGSGNPADYKSVNPAEPSALFPNKKVVGGIDLVGTKYNAAGKSFEEQVPVPDANPLDEGEHGTHVAGTVAGIGDDEHTYSGVAPDALLYAIKVFGADGSTNDYVVTAALEFAADPDGDGNPADHLDVVNMSLGGGFGQPMILYTEAVRNLTRAGTVVVASAGNSGPTDYIVGAPSTSDDALSVAASVDSMPHNWMFPAAGFKTPKGEELLAKAVQGPISKPIEDTPNTKGPLVYIGLGDRPLNDAEKAALKGKVAFLDRGKVNFAIKLQLASDNGAIGAVVANNQPGEPIAMGGDGTVSIPAIMITKELGDKIKEEMKAGDVVVTFVTGKEIEEPKLIDTITDFSSKGPRSEDSLLKPEIAAPGANIISAAMGSGFDGVQFSGTSMSAPHMAGVMALLRQVHPDVSVEGLKSLAMSTSVSIHDKQGREYPLSLQGAGRINTFAAATAPLTISPSALSIGNVQVGSAKTLRREITLTNISNETVKIQPGQTAGKYLTIAVPGAVELAAGASKKIFVLITLAPTPQEQTLTEINGAVVLKTEAGEQRVPVIAMVTKQSDLAANGLKVAASPGEGAGAHAELTLKNTGSQSGIAMPFNLIGFDQRKARPGVTDSFRSRSCDLESAGYRIIKKEIDGETQDVLQVAVKLYEPVTTWILCEVSVQIDTNGDDKADQELAGIPTNHLAGLPGAEYRSLLLDAVKAREIRANFERDMAAGKEDAELSYLEAIVDVQAMLKFDQSTLAMVEAPMKKIGLRKDGTLAVKIAALNADSDGFEADDFLGRQLSKWTKLGATGPQSGFYDLPEGLEVPAGVEGRVVLTKGAGNEQLIVYMPNNSALRSAKKDPQTKVLKPEFVGAAQP